MISTRSGSGLGDSLYLQSIARHFVEQGHKVEVCSAWPDVFRPLGDKVKVSPFRRDRITNLAHYSLRRGIAGTTQFEDGCIQAGIKEPIDLRLDWTLINLEWKFGLANDKPVIAVQLPRAPMGRKDGFGAEVLPDCRVIQKAIDRLHGLAEIVQIGSGKSLFSFSGIDVDLANKTSVCDLLDVASVVDGFLGYCSFLIPLAESFKKPAFFVWSRRGLNAHHQMVRNMKPQKILHRPSSHFVIDDCSEQELTEGVNALLDAARGPRTV